MSDTASKKQQALKQAEQVLKDGERLFRAVWEYDAPFGPVEGSFGVSYDAFMELVHPQDRTLVGQEMRRALEEGTDFKVEFRAGLANGMVRWKSIQGQVLYDEAGKPIRMMGVSVDIHQGRQVEEAR